MFINNVMLTNTTIFVPDFTLKIHKNPGASGGFALWASTRAFP